MNPPANWYPDPTERHEQRYWDGEQWTDHVYTDGVQGIDPLDAATGGGDVADDDAVTTAADEPASIALETASGGHVDQTTAVEPDADVWSPGDGVAPGGDTPWEVDTEAEDDADAELDDGAGLDDGAESRHDDVAGDDEVDEGEPVGAGPQDGLGASVAPEVEPEDVVATVDDVEPATGVDADFSDAFLLSPETASRLVARATEAGPAEETTDTEPTDTEPEDTEPEDVAPGDERPIDAPPPSMPPSVETTPSPASLGITGDLVGGAFSEREDAGAVGLQNARLLRCSASGGVIARQGTMVAYQGDVTFERQGAGSVGRVLKRAATGEGLAMMRVAGNGDVFLADAGQHVFLLHLDGGPGLSVNGRNVLAFSAALHWDIERVKGANLLAGGLFNTTLTGTGWVALVSDGEPVVLRTDEAPTYVDVNALVAWSAGLTTQIANTMSAKSLVGLGSGEAFQMAFDGAGIVIVQPSEGPLGGPSG